MTRTDIHRPAVIVPDEYDYVAIRTMKIEGMGDALFLKSEREALSRHMSETGAKYSQHAHGGSCHVCGAHAIYLAVFHHKPTNVYICTGFDCAEKMEWDSGLGEAFRHKMKAVRDRAKGKAKAELILGEAGIGHAWTVYTTPNRPDRFEENTIADIVGKLVQYGSISEKQMTFLTNLVKRLVDRPMLEEARAIEKAFAFPVPVTDARIKIVGEVTSVFYDKDWNRWNMTIKTVDGWSVKGTRPSGIEPAKGDRVEFLATVKPSKNDTKFGYFSRPTKPKIL